MKGSCSVETSSTQHNNFVQFNRIIVGVHILAMHSDASPVDFHSKHKAVYAVGCSKMSLKAFKTNQILCTLHFSVFVWFRRKIVKSPLLCWWGKADLQRDLGALQMVIHDGFSQWRSFFYMSFNMYNREVWTGKCWNIHCCRIVLRRPHSTDSGTVFGTTLALIISCLFGKSWFSHYIIYKCM